MLAVLTLGFGAAVRAMPLGQSKEKRVAQAAATSSAIIWESRARYAKAVLTVSTPDGEVIRREFKAGESISFNNSHEGQTLPDGQYIYELRFTPALSSEDRRALAEARAKEGDQEAGRDVRRRSLQTEAMVQSGAFQIIGGGIVMGEENESSERTDNGAPAVRRVDGLNSVVSPYSRLQRPVSSPLARPYASQAILRGSLYPSLAALRVNGVDPFFDQVINDDLIVQMSICVGFDCVNGESFGFDTIRLKENNTRIKFEDTSTGTFPSTDWQLTANDSASGGANKFSIEDITSARVPFTITGGAPTNSIFVDSSGRVGLRTATPVLELHMSDGDTPAMRLEQNGGSGFTPQTWDVAGNETNFFIRDVTGGSLLPFRIRPGAPTSSLDINASGNVGLGTQSPLVRLHVGNGTLVPVTTGASLLVENGDATSMVIMGNSGGEMFFFQSNLGGVFGTASNHFLDIRTNNLTRVRVTAAGNIGIGTLTPTNPIEHSSGAKLTAGGMWMDASSRTLKTNIRNLTARQAFDTLLRLNPVTFEYKAQPGENYVGFIAEDVPELVATDDRKTLSPMDVVAVLTKVVQEQQKTIDELKEKVLHLEKRKVKAAHRKPRR